MPAKPRKVQAPSVDLADARIVQALLVCFDAAPLAAQMRVHRALAAKDLAELRQLTRDFPAAVREGLLALVSLYGDETRFWTRRARSCPTCPASAPPCRA
jgi:ATP phosphoribosyltransferase regulatory subunit HisZ